MGGVGRIRFALVRAVSVPALVSGMITLGTTFASAQGTPPATTETLSPGSDYLCQTVIQYSWKPAPPKKKHENPGIEAPEEAEARKEFGLTGTEQGLIQAVVEARLKARIPALQSQALLDCKAAHESEAGCIAAHLEKHKRQYAEMDYTARRALLDAITNDCRAALGQCVSAEAGPVQCAQNKPPELADAPPKADEKGAKADTKKK